SRVSSPRSPITRSESPAPPSAMSLPRPPWTRSAPGPPQSRSLPRLPRIVSPPPPPQITSRPEVPRSTSAPSVPTIFARRPWQRVSTIEPFFTGAAATKTVAASATTPAMATLTLREDMTRSSEVDHHMLNLGVVLERVDGKILAVAGLLEAAVRHLGDERDVVVDPDAAELERVGDSHRAADVTRPHRGRQPVAGPVRPLDCLRLVRERLHRDHRAEDLVLDHLVPLLEAGDHRRLEEEPGQVGLGAAAD